MQQAITDAFAVGYLARTPDLGSWPCDAGGAYAVRIQLPAEVGPLPSPTPGPQPMPSPRVLAAETDLRPSEIQDLSDRVGALTNLATQNGVALRFHLRVEVTGNGNHPISPDLQSKLNELLDQVKSGLTVS